MPDAPCTKRWGAYRGDFGSVARTNLLWLRDAHPDAGGFTPADPERDTFSRELRPIYEEFVRGTLAVSGLDCGRRHARAPIPARRSPHSPPGFASSPGRPAGDVRLPGRVRLDVPGCTRDAPIPLPSPTCADGAEQDPED
ncbi:hypothetical protein GCM10023080_092430 [Streptomyces pseudoechinosporeus]